MLVERSRARRQTSGVLGSSDVGRRRHRSRESTARSHTWSGRLSLLSRAVSDASVERWRDLPAAMLMLAPSLVLLSVFVLYPLGRAMWLGQQRCNAQGKNCRSNGWDQYIDVDPQQRVPRRRRRHVQVRPDHRADRARPRRRPRCRSPTSTCAASAPSAAIFSSTVATSVAVASLMWCFLLATERRRAVQRRLDQRSVPGRSSSRGCSTTKARPSRPSPRRASGRASGSRSSW